ncbi:hypothetical protein [Paraburkholderia sp. BR10882]|uniref:hypothetical protein n=1 Tax=unclassified Paraburkholderia TaxID=2615204 RepID=UPI0034CD8828
MTEASKAQIIRPRDVDDAILRIRDMLGPGCRLATFSGFSSAGYEDEAFVEGRLLELLSALDPTADVVCSGATSVGIGLVYTLAKSPSLPNAFKTIGIVSSQALREQVPFSDDVDCVFVIEDDQWGGYLDNGTTLSPTSRVMVEASDIFFFIGGGEIARDEYACADVLGKSLHFDATDMKHETAIEKARRKGEAPPTDFAGAVFTYRKAMAR